MISGHLGVGVVVDPLAVSLRPVGQHRPVPPGGVGGGLDEVAVPVREEGLHTRRALLVVLQPEVVPDLVAEAVVAEGAGLQTNVESLNERKDTRYCTFMVTENVLPLL